MSRPPKFPQNNIYQPGPSPQPYQQYPAYPTPFPQQPYNLSGGYQPYAAYPNYAQPQIQYQYQYQYAQPYPSQPYQTLPQPTFGQSLFHSRPTATPEGYSYSSEYLQSPQQTYGAGPSKRSRQEPPNPSVNSVKAWRNCSQAGCKFVGSGEDVEIHEGDRHLIFPEGYKVERSEEEERYAKMKGPAPTIEGTGIRLETEEDIAKWVAERKAKWPSAQRVTEKVEERNAAIARGDMPRGRGRGRGRGGFQRSDPAARAEDWGREALEVDDSSEGGFRGRGRGRGRGRENVRGRVGDRGRGRGRDGVSHPDQRSREQEQDAGWGSHGPPSASDTQGTALPQSNAAVGPLATLGEYDSASSDSSNASSSTSDSSSESEEDSETESTADSTGAPDEMDMNAATDVLASALNADLGDSAMVEDVAEDVIVEDELGIHPDRRAMAQTPQSDEKKVCRFFAKNGRCRAGNKCDFAHTNVSASNGVSHTVNEGGQTNTRRKQPRHPAAKPPNPFARPSMLASLLEVPIQNTLSQLSQTIRFLVANDMLRNVEFTPGQAEEEERGKRKIEVLDEANITSTTES